MTTSVLQRSFTSHGTSRRSLILLVVSVVLGLLHHTDHVLRADHSGWPFQPRVTPFTFSLLVYVLFALAFLVGARPLYSATMVMLVLGLTQFSHVVFELPHDQYHTWAMGANLLHVHAPLLGVMAVGLSMILSCVLLATVISFIADTRRTT